MSVGRTHPRALRRVAEAKALALGGLLLLAGAACNESPPSSATPACVKPAIAPKSAASASALQGTGAKLVIDLSTSMAGFAGSRKSGGNTMESVLHAIADALGENQVALDVCEMGSAELPKCGQSLSYARYRESKVFSVRSSPVATALSSIAQNQKDVAEKSGIAKGVVDDARITVVMTDGLQVDGALAAQLPSVCQKGADVFCLREVLLERAAQGYGIWLVAASLPFDGKVFTERGISKEQFALTQAHVAKLQDASISQNQPAPQLGPLVRGEQSQNDFYAYRGPRPLVLLVVSQDVKLGASVVEKIQAGLKREGVLVPANKIEAVQLTRFEPAQWHIGQLRKLPPSTKGLAAEAAEGAVAEAARFVQVGKPAGLDSPSACAAFQCVANADARGKGSFEVVAKRSQPTQPALPSCMQETFTLWVTPSSAAKNAVQISGDGSAAQPSKQVTFDCNKLLKSQASLSVEAHAGLAVASNCSGWWTDWSSPDTFQMPDRVYRLEGLVQSLLSTAAVEESMSAAAMVSISTLTE